MDRIIFNGSLVKREEVQFSIDNRGFRYGDGIFETMRMFDGKLPFLEEHIQRLKAGMSLLQLDLSKHFGVSFWRFEIRRIVKYCRQKFPDIDKNFRIRLAVFRNEGGFYTPKSNTANYIIELIPLENDKFKLNDKGLELGIYRDVFVNTDKLSNLKTSNSLPYVLAGLYREAQGLDECLILNHKGNIAEGISANVFFIKGNKLITPALSEGCTDGTLRKIILRIADDLDYKIKEKSCELSILEEVEEVFCTNAIQGIQWIETYKNTKFTNQKTKQLLKKVNKIIKTSEIVI